MKTTISILALILVLATVPSWADTRLVHCPADEDVCWREIAKAARGAKEVLVSLSARWASVLSRQLGGTKVIPMPGRFTRLFCLVTNDKAVLGGWRPSGKVEADIVVTDDPRSVSALRSKLTTGKGTRAPGLWFPETGARNAWRRLSLPRKEIRVVRPRLDPTMVQTLTTMSRYGIRVSVETSRGISRNLLVPLIRAGVRVKVKELPPSRHRRYLTKVDEKTILGLPGEVLVLVKRPEAKFKKGDEAWKGGNDWKEKILDFLKTIQGKLAALVKGDSTKSY